MTYSNEYIREARTALDALVTHLDVKSAAIRVSLKTFEALLILSGKREVNFGQYSDNGRRFMQFPSFKYGSMSVAVTTDQVPERIPADARRGYVAAGLCPDCGEPMFAFAPTLEGAAFALTQYGIEIVL